MILAKKPDVTPLERTHQDFFISQEIFTYPLDNSIHILYMYICTVDTQQNTKYKNIKNKIPNT